MMTLLVGLFFAFAVLCAILYLLDRAVENQGIRRGLQALAVFIFLFALARHYGYI